jgi:hypothetical protein
LRTSYIIKLITYQTFIKNKNKYKININTKLKENNENKRA